MRELCPALGGLSLIPQNEDAGTAVQASGRGHLRASGSLPPSSMTTFRHCWFPHSARRGLFLQARGRNREGVDAGGVARCKTLLFGRGHPARGRGVGLSIWHHVCLGTELLLGFPAGNTPSYMSPQAG